MKLIKKELVQLALYKIYKTRDEFVQPYEATQTALAETIGINRPHVAVELKRLIDAGMVSCSLSHVRGRNGCRVKCFNLTPAGYDGTAVLVRTIGGPEMIDRAIHDNLPPEEERDSVTQLREDLARLQRAAAGLEERITVLESKGVPA